MTTQELALELTGLAPDPLETWQRLRQFLGLDEDAITVMQRTSESLLHGADQFVIDTYDYLASFDETAAVLGWETKMDEEHLRERRQFFSTWLARTIGVDLSDEFANYLFRAGKYHAGHGPRHIHTPDLWVLGSIGFVQAHFARRIIEDGHDPALAAAAIGGWSKYLMLQTRQMLAGYEVAKALDEGAHEVEIKLFGRLRSLVGLDVQPVRVHLGTTIAAALRKFFDYHPILRNEVFERQWRTPEANGAATWITDFDTVYVPRQGPHWRILLNGRDVSFQAGMAAVLSDNDVISLFPPGR